MPKRGKPLIVRKLKEGLIMSKNFKDGRKNNNPPDEHKFKKGQSGNPAGRPKKRNSTFADEIKTVFGKEREITIDGVTKTMSMRQVILEQIARGAAQQDPKMIKMSLPFLKVMDDAPDFEELPEDRKVLENFMKQFDADGGVNHEE